jgi:hypothetical protein
MDLTESETAKEINEEIKTFAKTSSIEKMQDDNNEMVATKEKEKAKEKIC